MNEKDNITIYHNGECSKSKGALEIMIEQNIPHQMRWYIAEPLDKNELTGLLRKLDIRPFQLVRTNEPLYKEQYEEKSISDNEWLDILLNNPILIQRPIVVKGEKAVIARPPERIYELI